MSIKTNIQLPEPAVLCMHYWQHETALIKVLCVACIRTCIMIPDTRWECVMCHPLLASCDIHTQTPRISDASYYATVIANLLVRGNMRAVHFTRHIQC